MSTSTKSKLLCRSWYAAPSSSSTTSSDGGLGGVVSMVATSLSAVRLLRGHQNF